MYFTSGSDRAFEQLMQGKPGFDHYDSGDAGAPEDCGDCRFYRPDWKYQFCGAGRSFTHTVPRLSVTVLVLKKR